MKILTFIFINFFIVISNFAQEHKHKLKHLLVDWFKGQSDSIYCFKYPLDSQIINPMKDAFQVKRAREFWYNKNMTLFKNGDRNWYSVTNFLGRFKTLIGVYKAGFDDIEQTIGGYTIHILPHNKDTVKFIIIDIKSKWSLFYHLPFIKNTPYNRESKKRMQNMIWQFEWYEPIKTEYFYQRQMNQILKKRPYSGYLF